MRTFQRTLERTGVLQVDSVNVLQRAHYMPLYSRMGPYDVDLLRRASARAAAPARRVLGARPGLHAGRAVAAHAAPDGDVPRPRGQVGGLDENPALEASLVAEIRDRGAATARDLDDGLPRTKEHWGWNWSDARQVLDYLFMAGDARDRRPQQPVRGPLRPARAGDPRRRAGAADAQRRGGPPRAGPACRALARGRHRALPARLLPDARRPGAPRDRDARRDRGAAPGHGRGLEAPGVPPPRRPPPAPRGRAGPAQPVRPGRLGARADRAALRLPLPHRDLRAAPRSGSTATTCCRSCSATGSSAGSTSRPTASRVACWSRRRTPSPAHRPRPATSSSAELRRLADWLELSAIVVEPRGDLASSLRC